MESLIGVGLGDHGSEVHSNIGLTLLIIIIITSLVQCIPTKAFNAYLQPPSTKQMTSLSLEEK